MIKKIKVILKKFVKLRSRGVIFQMTDNKIDNSDSVYNYKSDVERVVSLTQLDKDNLLMVIKNISGQNDIQPEQELHLYIFHNNKSTHIMYKTSKVEELQNFKFIITIKRVDCASQETQVHLANTLLNLINQLE